MGPREGNEADSVSLVRHLTEGNGLHEYFMGFGCIFPHIHNLFVLLEMARSMTQGRSNFKKCDIQNVKKKLVWLTLRFSMLLFFLTEMNFTCDMLTQTLKPGILLASTCSDIDEISGHLHGNCRLSVATWLQMIIVRYEWISITEP